MVVLILGNKINETFSGTIAILHTAHATVPLLKKNINERIPNAKIINFVDDSILPMLMENKDNLTYCFEKFLCYAKFAEKQKASLIINACSSVGQFSVYSTGKLHVPLIRIDDPATDLVAENNQKIAVLATIKTTLEPSTALLHSKADEHAKIDSFLLDGAFQMNSSGNKEAHDKLISEKIKSIADDYDSIFLAQASMAEAMNYLDEDTKSKVYTSVPYAMDKLVEICSSKLFTNSTNS